MLICESNKIRKETIMSDLVVIGFDDEHTAFEMRAELTKDEEHELRAVLESS